MRPMPRAKLGSPLMAGNGFAGTSTIFQCGSRGKNCGDPSSKPNLLGTGGLRGNEACYGGVQQPHVAVVSPTTPSELPVSTDPLLPLPYLGDAPLQSPHKHGTTTVPPILLPPPSFGKIPNSLEQCRDGSGLHNSGEQRGEGDPPAGSSQHLSFDIPEQRETEELNEEEAGGNQLVETDEDPNDDDEEEEEQIQNLGSGNNVNRQNSEVNESGNQESEGGENDENQEENTSWLVVVEEVEDDEEEDEEERRRTRVAEKGKQPMGDQGGISITELNDEDEDHHLDLAILKAMCDYECIIRNSPQLPTFNNRLVYVKDSFPDLKMSREALEEKIIALCKSFNDVREQLGDDPEMARPIDREIFNLSMIIWGRR
uniref:Brix domain n=1 Tax=Solanum tuberosum TaxID=4113 RepID=M1DMN8_SOLTU